MAAILYLTQLVYNLGFSWLCKFLFTCKCRIIDFVDSSYQRSIFRFIIRLLGAFFWEFPKILYQVNLWSRICSVDIDSEPYVDTNGYLFYYISQTYI